MDAAREGDAEKIPVVSKAAQNDEPKPDIQLEGQMPREADVRQGQKEAELGVDEEQVGAATLDNQIEDWDCGCWT